MIEDSTINRDVTSHRKFSAEPGIKKPEAEEYDIFKSTEWYPAIDKALERSCVNNGRREPCYTAALTSELPRVLNEMIGDSGCSPRYRFGSCYVHQKPYVRFGQDFKTRCELGDLLVLMKRTIDCVPVFNSALFQLKRLSGKKFRVSRKGGENTQFSLYTKWGKLKIGMKSESDMVYDIMPHAVSQGASYMFIREERPQFVVAVPNREMEIAPVQSLGCYLSEMLKWRSGRTIASWDDTRQNCADDWSKLIWKVIDLIKDASCSCKGYGRVTRDNGCGDLAFLMNYLEIDSIGESENMNSDAEMTSDPNVTGFGVLCIEKLDDSEHRSVRE